MNPFTTFGYFLNDMIPRDWVRNANNNLLKRCDELWVYGSISEGVLAEIQMFKEIRKPIIFFEIQQPLERIVETSTEDALF